MSTFVRHARFRLLAVLVALTAFFAAATPASAFNVGFNDDNLMGYAGWNGGKPDDAALTTGLANARGAGAQTWRFMVIWRGLVVSPTAPQPATAAADPAWSGYDWNDIDRIVRAASAQGFELLPWITRAPDWAEGSGRPAKGPLHPAGTWKPSPAALEQFAKAFATRYSGTYPDPLRPGQVLPRIGSFQGWNEPNLYTEITPQWERRSGRWTMYSAASFRNLLNAFYRGIKAVQPTARVVAGGTGPFGDFNPGDARVQPAAFWRQLLCVSKRRGKLVGKRSCPKLRFDVWAHHTYPIGPPTRTARNPDDVVVPDMAKLKRIIAAAARKRTVSKAAARQLWITEMSWESRPDPEGLPVETHALYMEGAFYVLWKAKVQRVIWFNSRDNAKGPDWNGSLQSGIFARGATPAQDTRKPAYTAFRFPFTAYRRSGVAALWSKPPATTPVAIEVNQGGRWVSAVTLKPGAGGVQTGRLRVGPGVQLRAVQGSEISLTWKTD